MVIEIGDSYLNLFLLCLAGTAFYIFAMKLFGAIVGIAIRWVYRDRTSVTNGPNSISEVNPQ